MCRNYFYCLIFVIIFIFANCLQGQVALRDVYGNPLPSTWPPPDSAIYRYTIWGKRTEVSVQEDDKGINIRSVNCEVRNVLGEQRVYINYFMEKSGPITISIYDNLVN